MIDAEKWQIMQKEASRNAKREFLNALLSTTGLGEYIADAIARHEKQMHDET